MDFSDIALLLRGVCFRVDFVDFAVFADFAVFVDLIVLVDFIVFVDLIVLVDFTVFVDFADLTDLTLLLSSNFRGRPRFVVVFVDFAVVVDLASVFCGLSGFSVLRDFLDEYDFTVGVGFLYIRF